VPIYGYLILKFSSFSSITFAALLRESEILEQHSSSEVVSSFQKILNGVDEGITCFMSTEPSWANAGFESYGTFTMCHSMKARPLCDPRLSCAALGSADPAQQTLVKHKGEKCEGPVALYSGFLVYLISMIGERILSHTLWALCLP
jgi:hypothetical protein